MKQLKAVPNDFADPFENSKRDWDNYVVPVRVL